MFRFRFTGKFNTQFTEFQDIYLRKQYRSMNLASF